MFDNKLPAVALTALLVLAAVAPAAMAASSQQRAYAGSNVSFDTTSTTVVDYAVDGETMMESVRVQSGSTVESGLDVGVGADVAAVTDFAGAGLSMSAESETSATITAESGAEMRAHDSTHGILVVDSGGEDSQYVGVNLSSSTEAESESDSRVVVTTDDGAKGTFVVVGNGSVAVNDEGNVTAKLASDSRLVFRAYSEERTEDEKRQEELIADGTAAAEVYVRESGEASDEFAAGVANYSQDTAVEVTQTTEGTVNMTAERAESEGRVIVTSVSEAVISSTEDLSVTVDGEAAVRASSYSELESAADGGDTSKFLVRQQSNAQASADVLVAVNHFSERTVTVSDDGDSADDGGSTDDDGSSDGPTDTDSDDASGGDNDDDSTEGGTDGTDTSTPGAPGFGVGAAVIALLAGALLASRLR